MPFNIISFNSPVRGIDLQQHIEVAARPNGEFFSEYERVDGEHTFRVGQVRPSIVVSDVDGHNLKDGAWYWSLRVQSDDRSDEPANLRQVLEFAHELEDVARG